jgi:hypothetical protein
VHQKEDLELRLADARLDRPPARQENVLQENTKERISAFREALKADIADISRNGPDMSVRELKERTGLLIMMNLEKAGSTATDQILAQDMGREIGEGLLNRKPHEIVRSAVINGPEIPSRIR